MMTALYNMLKNSTGDGLCPVRLFGVGFALITTMVFFALACWTVLALHQPLDYSGFGGGAAAVWGVVGASIALKTHTEKR